MDLGVVQSREENVNNKNRQFWQEDNHPIALSTNEMMEQNLEYPQKNR
jgi:putative transposase